MLFLSKCTCSLIQRGPDIECIRIYRLFECEEIELFSSPLEVLSLVIYGSATHFGSGLVLGWFGRLSQVGFTEVAGSFFETFLKLFNKYFIMALWD